MSRLIDDLSKFLAPRKGLLPLVGCALIIANFALRLALPGAWLTTSDLLLHVGAVLGIFGLLLARVL